jgi:hypothetical protein
MIDPFLTANGREFTRIAEALDFFPRMALIAKGG